MPHIATADDFRIALLQAALLELERLRREGEGFPRSEELTLSKAAGDALVARLTPEQP